MKTFRQFQEESKGFGGEKKKKRKAKKRGYLSPRDAKLVDLKQRPSSWQGLESKEDPRTPKTYFVKKRVPASQRIAKAIMEGKLISAEYMIKEELSKRLGQKQLVREAVALAGKEIERQVFR